MLVDLNITEFAKQVASEKSIMPAGGCVAALTGLMGVSLIEMSLQVSSLKKPEYQGAEIADLQKILQQIHQRMLSYIEKDAEAFNRVMAILKLKKKLDEPNRDCEAEQQAAMLAAIEVPLNIVNDCILGLECSQKMIKMITPSVEGDLQVGILTTKASADGALLTAKINVLMLKDKNKAEELLKQIGMMQEKLGNTTSI